MKRSDPRPVATRDPVQTRTRILDEAEALFVARGFSAVSMRDIAAASGVTKSLIHHYFASKEQLWTEVKERVFAAYAEEQQRLLAQPVAPDADVLRRSVEAYFRYLQRHPEAVRLFAWAHLEGDPGDARTDRDLVAVGAERVRAAQDAGVLRGDVNPAHVVAIFVHTCTQWFEAAEHHAEWPGVGGDEAFLEDFLKVFLEGLLPRSPR